MKLQILGLTCFSLVIYAVCGQETCPNEIKGSLASTPPAIMCEYIKRMTIYKVYPSDLKLFFSLRDHVVRLADCLVDRRYCNLKFGFELHDHLEAVNAGTSDLCPNCDRQMKIEQLKTLLDFISNMQDNYMDQWLRVAERFDFVSHIKL